MFDDVRSAFWFPIFCVFSVVFSDAMFHWRISTAPRWPSAAVPGDTRTAWISWINGRRTRRGFRCDAWRPGPLWCRWTPARSAVTMHRWSDHGVYPCKHGLLVNPPLMRGLLPLKPPCIRDFPLPRLMTGNQFVIIPYTSLNIFNRSEWQPSAMTWLVHWTEAVWSRMPSMPLIEMSNEEEKLGASRHRETTEKPRVFCDPIVPVREAGCGFVS